MKHAMIPLSILFCAVFAQIATAQQAPAKTAPSNQPERNPKREGAITGRVIGVEGQPMANVGVYARQLVEKPRATNSATSDDDGNFKLTGLSSGAYVLSAYCPGYIAAENAIHRIGENVTVNMVKGGVITGRVTDETREPIVGVHVLSHRLRDLDGKTAGSGFEKYSLNEALTDDRGIYRIYGLPPGVYIVRIASEYSFDSAHIIGDATTYYPSATRDTAGEINLGAGEEVSGIDIRHRGDRGRIVSGAVSGGSESSPLLRLYIKLKALGTGFFEAGASSHDSRGFAFYGVPDGAYELIARRVSNGGDEFSSARRRIVVKGADVSGIELKLSPHGSISGRVVIESSNATKKCAADGAQAENQTSSQASEQAGRRSMIEELTLKADLDEPNPRAQLPLFDWASVYGFPPNEKGEFALKNLEAGRYRIAVNLSDDGWRLRAITMSGQSGAGTARQQAGAAKSSVDAARDGVAIKPGEKLSGVEVIIVEDAATLNGRVLPSKNGMKLPSLLRVHLIPAEVASADDVVRYAETDVRDDGSFEFKHIAPGKYLLHARQIVEKEANDNRVRPVAWDAVERAKLRSEAVARKNEIELQACGRVKNYVLQFND